MVNEFIARKANSEDNCTGRFWQGQFKSQALLAESAILSCMMYVDLNPIRAKIADSLKESDFTSIQERINEYQAFQKQPHHKNSEITVSQQPRKLLHFGCSIDKNTIPFTLFDYLELADFSSRLVEPNKLGSVESTPAILNELNIEIDTWVNSIQHFRRQYANFAGSKAFAHELRSFTSS